MDDYQELLVSMDGADTYLLSEWKLWLEQYQSDVDNAILKMQSEIQYTGDTIFSYELFYNLWFGMKLLGEKLDRVQYELIHIPRYVLTNTCEDTDYGPKLYKDIELALDGFVLSPHCERIMPETQFADVEGYYPQPKPIESNGLLFTRIDAPKITIRIEDLEDNDGR